MNSVLFALRCNTEFSMKKPEVDIEDYEKERLTDVDSGDSSEGNEASE